MRIGKISVLLCALAPALGVAVTHLTPAGEHDFYGIGPIGAGLATFAGFTLAGGIVGVVAKARGSGTGVYTMAWSALSLTALAAWALSFSGGG